MSLEINSVRGNAGDRLAFWEWMAIVAFAIGLVLSVIYAISVGAGIGDAGKTFALVAGVGCAAWLFGSVLGFLFGVPRFQADTREDASRVVPNTNLEQISDWLTKIIVGATLVQVGTLSNALVSLSVAIGQEIARPGASVAVGSAIILFFAAGFMWGYLWCSLRVFREVAALIARHLETVRVGQVDPSKASGGEGARDAQDSSSARR